MQVDRFDRGSRIREANDDDARKVALEWARQRDIDEAALRRGLFHAALFILGVLAVVVLAVRAAS